ncbi:MAG: META domain-containing protein [Deltaproteobacteria bacterium]|nr:MAG: META domain-containing protein [Deltaproteobacteria bacterium]
MKTEKKALLYVLVLVLVIMPVTGTSGQAQSESYGGFYVFGHEVRAFQPCGSDSVYWVRADQEISKHLREEYQKLTSKPYEPIYIEVQGHLTDKATEGFAADYDGQFVIEALNLSRGRQKEDSNSDTASRILSTDPVFSVTGVVWQWQQTRYNNDQQAAPDDPPRYTIVFQPDGRLNIRADCNRAGGKYTVQDSRLTIEVTHSTRAACPPDSLEQTFLKNLNAAAIYFMREGHLYIDLKYDSGTMKFSK